MTAAFVDALLGFVFPAGAPPWLDRMVDRALVARHLEDYKLNPIVPLDAGRPARIALADTGAPDAWAAGVLAAFPDGLAARALSLAPPGTRRMLDTDGRAAKLYLDDLQDIAHALPSPTGDPLMSCVIRLDKRAKADAITRHTSPPRDHLPAPLLDRLDALEGASATGLWGVRWRGDRAVSLLWITEARWRRDAPAKTRVLAAAFPLPARWQALADLADRHGLLAYPDALEMRPSGGLDLTVGFLAAAQRT